MKRVFESISRGLLLIVLGIIFFLINFGILSWSFWSNVADLWPLLLILGGIGLFFSRRIPMSVVLVIFLIILVGYSMMFGYKIDPFFNHNNWNNGNEYRGSSGSVVLDTPLAAGVKKADVELKLGGASIQIQGVSEDNNLALGDYNWGGGLVTHNPEFNIQQTGDHAKINLTAEKKNGQGSSELNLSLTDKVEYSFDIKAGAINGDLDFSRIKVNNFDLDMGASRLAIQFGDNGSFTEASINGAASEIELIIPEQVGVRINSSSVVSKSDFSGAGLVRDGNKGWISPGFENAKSKVDLKIAMAVGSIDLKRQAGAPIKSTH